MEFAHVLPRLLLHEVLDYLTFLELLPWRATNVSSVAFLKFKKNGTAIQDYCGPTGHNYFEEEGDDVHRDGHGLVHYHGYELRGSLE
jgi:hypothetical protein